LHGEHSPVLHAAGEGFVLARDGVALAAVDPLGAFVHWRAWRASGTDAAG